MPHALQYNGEPLNERPNHLLVVEEARTITSAPTELQFRSGAAQQTEYLFRDQAAPLSSSSLLVTSPYNIEGHLLDLHRLSNIQDRILALALTKLQPTREDYATAPYEETLNWSNVRTAIQQLAGIARHRWTSQVYYVVVFRSQLREGYDRQLLWDLDRESHREAVESGGLLKYWFGKANDQRRNLATCKLHETSR